MTIQVEVSPETARQLAEEAHAQGVPLETCAEQLLRRGPIAPQRSSSRARFRSFLDELASGSPDAAHLPGERFSREMIYGDRD